MAVADRHGTELMKPGFRMTHVRVCAAHCMVDVGKEPRGLHVLTKYHQIRRHSADRQTDRLQAEAVNMHIYSEI